MQYNADNVPLYNFQKRNITQQRTATLPMMFGLVDFEISYVPEWEIAWEEIQLEND